MNIRAWSISLLLFLSTVTAVGQTANRYLKAPLPNGWEENGEVFQQTLPVDDHWWKSFGDSKLDSLIVLAVDRNYSVAMAINRIAAARANLWAERGNFFPSIGLNAGWTRQETSGNTSSIPQTTEHYYDASLSMSWEIDVFGSIRKRVKAQKENFAASKEEYTGVMISMAAEVASAYINLRELQQELEVVNKNCASQEEVLKITEVRYNTGLVAKLDVAQAKSVLYSTKASIPQLEAGINQYITMLAVLLGMYPQDIRPVLEPFLKGSFGYAARDLKDLTKSKSMMYEIAPSMSWTLFSGGQLVNATRLAKAQLDESINQFNQTVLTAVQETDNAMNSYRNSIKQIVALREVRNQGIETLKLSLELYKQGLSPFQNVLDAQRSLLSYENQLVQAQGNSLLQLITLYKALGGGWQE